MGNMSLEGYSPLESGVRFEEKRFVEAVITEDWQLSDDFFDHDEMCVGVQYLRRVGGDPERIDDIAAEWLELAIDGEEFPDEPNDWINITDFEGALPKGVLPQRGMVIHIHEYWVAEEGKSFQPQAPEYCVVPEAPLDDEAIAARIADALGQQKARFYEMLIEAEMREREAAAQLETIQSGEEFPLFAEAEIADSRFPGEVNVPRRVLLPQEDLPVYLEVTSDTYYPDFVERLFTKDGHEVIVQDVFPMGYDDTKTYLAFTVAVGSSQAAVSERPERKLTVTINGERWFAEQDDEEKALAMYSGFPEQYKLFTPIDPEHVLAEKAWQHGYRLGARIILPADPDILQEITAILH